MFARIMAAGAPHGMVFSSLESMGIRRIEGAILDNGTDMDPSMTPWQAGLGRFVDLDKLGGFVGRDALAAAPRDCLMFGLTCGRTTPVAGDLVQKGGTRVGRITAGAWSPALGTGIAYVRFDGPGHGPGDAVELTSGGDRHPAAVVALPFYDPEKKIPRGLATADV